MHAWLHAELCWIPDLQGYRRKSKGFVPTELIGVMQTLSDFHQRTENQFNFEIFE